MPDTSTAVRLQVGPYAQDQVTVSFEPTGMEYVLLAGDWLTVEIRAESLGLVEVGHTPDHLVIGGWAGSETLVWTKDGDQLIV